MWGQWDGWWGSQSFGLPSQIIKMQPLRVAFPTLYEGNPKTTRRQPEGNPKATRRQPEGLRQREVHLCYNYSNKFIVWRFQTTRQFTIIR